MSNDISELMQKLDQIEQQAKQEETATQETPVEEAAVEEDNSLENSLRAEFLGQTEQATTESQPVEPVVTEEPVATEETVDIVPQAVETDVVGTDVYKNYEELAIHTTTDDLQNLAGLDNEK